MTVYAVLYTYDQRTDERDRVRPAHRAYLGEMHDAGTLLASGPWAGPSHGRDTEPDGALLLVRAADVAAVEDLLDADPFAVAGLVVERTVRPWTPVFGPWTPDV